MAEAHTKTEVFMDFLQKMIPVTALILIVLFVLILIFRRLAYRRTATFKCPACGQVFRPTLMQLIFSVEGTDPILSQLRGKELSGTIGERNTGKRRECCSEMSSILVTIGVYSFYRNVIPCFPSPPKAPGLWINIYQIRILQGRPGGGVFQSRHHRPDTPPPSHF